MIARRRATAWVYTWVWRLLLSEDDRKVSEALSKLLYFNKRTLEPIERLIDTSSSDDNRNVFMHRFGSATGLSGFTCPDRTAATPFYHWQLRVPFLHRRWVFDSLFIVINICITKNVLWSFFFFLNFEVNIEIDIKETGREGVMWFHLAKVRTWWRFPVNNLINLRVPNLRHRVPGSECFKAAGCPCLRG